MTDHTTNAGADLPLDKTVALAQEYDGLMGLGYVALGVGFVFAAAISQPAVGIALGAVFCALSAPWYARRYGWVRPRPERTRRLLVGAVVAVLIVLVGYLVDVWLSPPVSASLLAVAVVLGGGQFLTLRRVGLTTIHWVVYGLLVLAAFAPLVGVAPVDLFSSYALVVTGIALIVVGVVDHRRLVAMMGAAPEENE